MSERLELTTVICNDSNYDAEYIQFVGRSMDPSISINVRSDLVPSAFGFEALTVRGSDDLN